MAVIFDETLTLTADELATVDSQVDNFVNVERNENGKFVFSNKAVIVYSYNPDTDALVYTIYSVKQATDLHVI